MFKKVLCLALALVMMMGMAVVGFSAAQVEVAEEAADTDVATTGADGVIYFDAASAGWSGVKWVSFYIYGLSGEGNITEWGAKNKQYTSHDGDIWAFNAKAAGVQDGHEYGIIFENLDTTAQTADLLFNSSCFGDTAYVPNPNNKIENAVDSNKKSMKAAWKSSSLGTIKQITSLGNVVGESIPRTTSAYQMMVNFLASKGSQSLTNALSFNGKDAQTTIDRTAKALGLDQNDVEKAIKEAAKTGANDGTGDKTDWSSKWNRSKSSLPGGSSGSGSSSDSSSGSTSTYTSIPYLTLSNAADGVKISWTKVYGASKYRVFYKGRNGWTRMADVSGTTYIDEVVNSGSTYTYTVRAISDDGSRYLSSYDGDGERITFVKAPVFSLSNAEDGVRISWSAVNGAAKYRVFYQGRNGWKKLVDTTSTSFIDTVVNSGSTYTYTVRCINSGATAYTSAYRAGKKLQFISAPSFSLSNAEDGVRISWNAVKGAAKYRVFYKGRNGWTKLVDTASTSFIDTVVNSGSTYTYTVRCINSGATAYTSDYRAGKKLQFISAPSFSLSNAEDGVRISWNAVKGAAKYRVFYKGKNGWTKLVDTTSTSFVDTVVKSGSTYTYTVRCINSGATAYTSDYRAGKSIKYTPASSEFNTAYETEVLRLVNIERVKYGLSPLSMDEGVKKVAHLRSKELAQSFSHTRPNGSSCFTAAQEAGLSYNYAGENIAFGYPNPEQAVNGWMNSEGHRNNILSAYFSKIGIGCYESNGMLYWLQFFIG